MKRKLFSPRKKSYFQKRSIFSRKPKYFVMQIVVFFLAKSVLTPRSEMRLPASQKIPISYHAQFYVKRKCNIKFFMILIYWSNNIRCESFFLSLKYFLNNRFYNVDLTPYFWPLHSHTRGMVLLGFVDSDTNNNIIGGHVYSWITFFRSKISLLHTHTRSHT